MLIVYHASFGRAVTFSRRNAAGLFVTFHFRGQTPPDNNDDVVGVVKQLVHACTSPAGGWRPPSKKKKHHKRNKLRKRKRRLNDATRDDQTGPSSVSAENASLSLSVGGWKEEEK